MNQQSSQNSTVEEITFAELTALVKKELQSADPKTDCLVLSKTYGISELTMRKLIDTVRLESNRS